MSESDDDAEEQVALVDLVNRVLDRGVSVVGEVTISVAGVDLVYLGLRLNLAAIEEAAPKSASARLGSLARRIAPPTSG